MAKWKQLATVDMLNNAGSIQYQSFSVMVAKRKFVTSSNWHWLTVNNGQGLGTADMIDTGHSNAADVTSITSANAANGVFCHNLYPLGGTMTLKRAQYSIQMPGWSGSGTDVMYAMPVFFEISGGETSYDVTHRCQSITSFLNASGPDIAFGSDSTSETLTGLNHSKGLYMGILMRANDADCIDEYFNFTFHMTYDAIEG